MIGARQALLAALVAFQALADPGASGPVVGPALPAEEVICPAVQGEAVSRVYGAFLGELRQPELVVLGTVRVIVQAGRDRSYEVEVEKVLYGSCKAKALDFSYGYYDDGQRRIFALVPTDNPQDRPFAARYAMEPEEEKAARALGEARLDYNALSSVCIFIGREVEVSDNVHRTVEVVRPLAGPGPAWGERVTVFLAGYHDGDDRKPVVRQEPEIYFIHTIDRDVPAERLLGVDRPPVPDGAKGPVYRARHRQPADREADVLAALKRRGEYPLTEGTEGGKPVRRREVVFRGPITDAIEFLGSENEAVVTLGWRMLVHERHKARPAVVAAIEQRLLQGVEQRRGDHRRLKNLIGVLAELCDPGRKDDDLRRLIDRHFKAVAGNAPEPPTPREREEHETYFPREEDRDDVNHALTWLLRRLDEPVARREYGERLIRLRDRAKGRWNDEVQLALEVCRIEDRIEVEAALERMKGIRPVRSEAGLRHPEGGRVAQVAFSPDGSHLATTAGGEVRVWRTSDGSPAGRVGDVAVDRLAFSPDGSLLYVAGGGVDSPTHARFDWRTGKLDRAYKGHKGGLTRLALSRDGRVMVSSSYYENVAHVWDTATGKILRSLALAGGCHEVAISPDGKTLVWQSSRKELTVEATAGGRKAVLKLGPEGEPNPLAFSPDGKYLVATSLQPFSTVQVRVFDAVGDFNLLCGASVRAERCTALAFSPDSRYVILGHQEGPTRAYSLPDLKPLKALLHSGSPRRWEGIVDQVSSVAFSPDGSVVAVGCDHPTPFLFRTGTFEPFLPTPGHAGRMTKVCFPADGKTVRTFGSDGTVCLWEAGTLKMLRRVALPADHRDRSIREPGGRYAVYFGGDGSPAHVVDADTGKVVCRVALPRAERSGRPQVHWLNDREAVFCDGTQLVRFDYRTGRILKELECEVESPVAPGNGGELVEDGSSLYWINEDPHSGVFTAQSVDLRTGKVRKLGVRWMPHFTGNRWGLVPGGKYFFVGDPDVYLLDRRTMEVVTQRLFRNANLGDLAFTVDGGRYAVVTRRDARVERQASEKDPEPPVLVRIHETLSGKTLGAFAPSTAGAKLRFSPDGRRLAVINEDDTLELWDLAPLAGP